MGYKIFHVSVQSMAAVYNKADRLEFKCLLVKSKYLHDKMRYSNKNLHYLFFYLGLPDICRKIFKNVKDKKSTFFYYTSFMLDCNSEKCAHGCRYRGFHESRYKSDFHSSPTCFPAHMNNVFWATIHNKFSFWRRICNDYGMYNHANEWRILSYPTYKTVKHIIEGLIQL